MNRVETLREQASILRSLAKAFDSPTICGDLLGLAKRCEELAAEAEREIMQRKAQPISG
jgi:hypothetical protein